MQQINSSLAPFWADLAAAQQKQREAEAAQQAAQVARQEAAEAAAKGPAMVRIPGKNYELGKYHVTRGEFAKFVNETSHDAGNECWTVESGKWEVQSGRSWRNPGFSQDDSHPVTCVNWNDTKAYVDWLSKKTGRQYRLPVEEEWEYACYGGSKTEYCGGNDLDAVGWFKDNSGRHTHPVGQKQANGYGLYDMTGNVWEWMENCYDSSCGGRALRGGSWGDISHISRAARRSIGSPGKRGINFGFRVARTLP